MENPISWGEGITPANDKKTSDLISRNLSIAGRRTSVRLEPEMWAALADIAAREGQKIHKVASRVQAHKRAQATLTSAMPCLDMAEAKCHPGRPQGDTGSYTIKNG